MEEWKQKLNKVKQAQGYLVSEMVRQHETKVSDSY